MSLSLRLGLGQGRLAHAHSFHTNHSAPPSFPSLTNSYERGTPCFRQLVKHFGPSIVGEDGGIDRRALGQIVFADPAKRKELEGIVWPEIRRLMERDIQALGEVWGSLLSSCLRALFAQTCVCWFWLAGLLCLTIPTAFDFVSFHVRRRARRRRLWRRR